ncbi:glutathione S-transferase family protein [Shimia biformata]|uniref:glutathione S-transferase family protein n=1 Tax=Shimia biformata TaxID=1294299 RepID=UPI00195119E5|nr:glutathione S-transferase family protein [Shimia biformata]
MRSLLFTPGSPFARAVRIVLDELGLDYERREENAAPGATETPTLQVPTFRDNALVLWESGTIAEYLMATYPHRPESALPLSDHMFRPGMEWQDKLVFSTIQTLGTAATTISQMTWTGVTVADNRHLQRSALKMMHILDWLEARLDDAETGFQPGTVSAQDIFFAAHVRFVQARPLGIALELDRVPKIRALLDRLDARASFVANPVWWWEPGVVGYEADGTPVFET